MSIGDLVINKGYLAVIYSILFFLIFFLFKSQLNDIRLDCVTHDVAVNEFRKADESVSLLVEKNAEAQLLVSSFVAVQNLL